MPRGFNNALDGVREAEVPRGCAEVWRYNTRASNWYGPELYPGLSLREARALLTNGNQLVRWRPPWRAADVLLTRTEVLLDRFRRKICTVAGCDRPVVGRGLCQKHYSVIRRAELAERERAIRVEGDW